MTIKKKIKLSNIMMVLIPILFTAAVIMICLHTSLGSYWYTLEAMYSDENGIQFAQSMIYTYQQELWENNWGQGEHTSISDEIARTDEMNHLENKLSGMGYQIMITKNENLIYSNMSEEDMQAARSVAGEAIDSAKTLTASRHEVSVIKNTFYHGEKAFCITAVHRQRTDQTVVNYLKNYILKYLYGIVLFFVALTVCVNGILSWWISRSILKPLRLLSMGTKEIREGNLNTEMKYQKKDEFGDVCRDFDDMRAYLKESVEQRLKDEKRRRDLITGISHDLRTPLTSIIGYLDGLLEGIADTPEKRTRYLQAIQIRTGNLVRLVDSLSEYSRLDNGFRYHMEEADFREFMEQYLEINRHDAQHNHVDIAFLYGEETYPVQIDREELKRVFDNLFTNTVKYRTADKSHVLISLKRTLAGTDIELIFQDDGPGVPEESLEQIFDSFYRVDDSRSQSEKGSGIGLAVVKEIILGHGGKVRAENREGLAVIIHLPIDRENTDGEDTDRRRR